MSKDHKYSFRAKPGRDKVIIDWLESVGERDRSYYIREALRSYLTGSAFQASPSPSITPNHINNVDNDAVKSSRTLKESNCSKPVSDISDEELERNLLAWDD